MLNSCVRIFANQRGTALALQRGGVMLDWMTIIIIQQFDNGLHACLNSVKRMDHKKHHTAREAELRSHRDRKWKLSVCRNRQSATKLAYLLNGNASQMGGRIVPQSHMNISVRK